MHDHLLDKAAARPREAPAQRRTCLVLVPLCRFGGSAAGPRCLPTPPQRKPYFLLLQPSSANCQTHPKAPNTTFRLPRLPANSTSHPKAPKTTFSRSRLMACDCSRSGCGATARKAAGGRAGGVHRLVLGEQPGAMRHVAAPPGKVGSPGVAAAGPQRARACRPCHPRSKSPPAAVSPWLPTNQHLTAMLVTVTCSTGVGVSLVGDTLVSLSRPLRRSRGGGQRGQGGGCELGDARAACQLQRQQQRMLVLPEQAGLATAAAGSRGF